MKPRHSCSGFTVMELLVVVAIIGIITALAIPAQRHVMIKVKRNRMLNTLKMISEDQLMYQRDHGTYYPEGFSFGKFTYVLKIIRQDETMILEGQGIKLGKGTRHYTYYIYRYEPFYPEPIIYAYAHRFYHNDLDGDSYADLWIKVGSGAPQLYYDDLTNTRHQVQWR